MATLAQFTIGVDVSCTDGLCGELRRVIVDPVAEAVTHIVVEPEPRDGESRLVPLDIVDVTSGEVRLRCTLAQFANLETIPFGEVDIRRDQPVRATDGDIGKVQGLVIDRGSRHITHVLLQEGHLWGRKEVAIPISAVASTRDGIHLTISKQEVQDLPPVEAVTWNIAI
jgi:hypothetical protein